MQRSRLQYAAAALRAGPERRVIDVALEAGYESLEGFSRAFRGFYGIAPSRWDRTSPLQKRKIGQSPDDFPTYTVDQLEEQAAADGFVVEIATLPETEVCYVRVPDAYQHIDDVISAYRLLMGWMDTGGYTGTTRGLYGVSWDDPDITPIDRCTFEWACAIPNGAPVPPPPIGVRIEAERTVAQIAMDGPIELEDRVWQYLYRVWLPQSRFDPAPSPAREIYRRPPDQWNWQRFSMWCALPVQR